MNRADGTAPGVVAAGGPGDVPQVPDRPWALSCADLLRALDVDVRAGLDEADAAVRLQAFGPNELRRTARRHVATILLDQLKSVVVALLMAAAAVSFWFGEHAEGAAILAVVLINTLIGFVTEWRAVRSMEALRLLGRVETTARRNGSSVRLPAEALVPGDVVLCEGGDVVTADMRLVQASRLEADESTLTGESLPVGKETHAVAGGTPLMERSNMLFKGSVVTRGSGIGVVVGTGAATELGRIASLVSAAAPQDTPLERRLNTLATRLVWIMLAIAALVAAVGVLAGRDAVLAIQVAIALAVAAIPEGLPIVATIALARGMWRMARRNALVARLSAVETLGATSVILTDKTGTLTENRMTVTAVRLAGADIDVAGTGPRETRGSFLVDGREPQGSVAARLDELLSLAALCNNASLNVTDSGSLEVLGDPTERALLIAAAGRGLDRVVLEERSPRLREENFDPQTKAMATFHSDGEHTRVAVKGAPEELLGRCRDVRGGEGNERLTAEERERWLRRVHELGARGLRTLAIATKTADGVDGSPYEDLTLIGILGLEDPAREGVRAAIRRCADAGIRVVMVTGDHAATAARIAADVGIVEADAETEAFVDARDLPATGRNGDDARLLRAAVISRATPEQKFGLIDLYQEHGLVVAMTGDGANDAPALKKADIGIAMGLRGTPVAREAAAMILQDDEFGTIVEAVSQGRIIYANIRKFVVYLLSCNLGEILIVGLATAAGAPLPLLPLQILFLNLVTDVFPALALGVGGGSKGQMEQEPRPARQPVLTGAHWALILAYGIVMSGAVLGAMGMALGVLGYGTGQAVTVSFMTLALAQLWHVFNMRSRGSAAFRNEITRNPWIWAALALCLLLVAGAMLLPPLRAVLALEHIGADGWLLVGIASVAPLAAGPALRRLMPTSLRRPHSATEA